VNNIVAAYSGNTNFDPDTSPALRQSVQKAGTTTNLRTSSNAPTLTLTATVSSATASMPTGSITFFEGPNQLGSEPLNAGGVATLTSAVLTAGNQNITASYSGDSNFNASTSSALPVAVGFAISGSSLSPNSISAGASAESTITITPSNGFNPSEVTLSCTITPAVSPAASCSVAPLSVSDDAGTAKLTVTTVGALASLNPALWKHDPVIWNTFGWLIPALLLAAGFGRSGHRQLLASLLAFALIGSCLFQMACGGGNSSTGGPGGTGTPAGNYTIIVTGDANGMHVSSQPLKLTVE